MGVFNHICHRNSAQSLRIWFSSISLSILEHV